MSRVRLASLVVFRAARQQRRVSALATALIAAATVDIVLAWTWLQGTVVLGVWIVFGVLVYSAVATAAPSREQAAAALETCGAGTAMAPLLAAIHAVLLGVAGSVFGLAVGMAVRAALVRAAPAHLANDTKGVIEAVVMSAAAAVAVAGMASAVTASLGPRHGVRRTRPLGWVLRVGFSLVALVVGIYGSATNAQTFDDLQIFLLVGAPLIALGAAGLASAALAVTLTALRGRGGTSWFITRSLGHRRRWATPVLTLITITVGACTFGAVMTSSLQQRVDVARADLVTNPHPAWATPHDMLSEVCTQDPAAFGPTGDCGSASLDPTVLADTTLALQDPNAEWVLILAVVILTMPLIVIAVLLDAAARADDDELLNVQGAAPSIRRRAAVLTTALLALVGTGTGVIVGLAGTAAGIALYDNRARFETNLAVFPPVPLTIPTGILVVLVVVVPIGAAAVAAVTASRNPSRLRLGLAQRVDEPLTTPS